MFKFSLLPVVCIFLFTSPLAAQNTLPDITVKNTGGQIIVSWVNNYKIPVANIAIQRSWDSLKNYVTIGSVLNPQSPENGYADVTPPYNKMYYRVFVSFDGGTYIFSKIARPVKEISVAAAQEDTLRPFLVKDNWTAQPVTDPKHNNQPGGILPKTQLPTVDANSEIITYPSRRIFTAKDNTVIILLPLADVKKYTIKFFDENEVPLFDINKVTENYLILEKANFIHAGWFNFELYENGKLIEKNRFFVGKVGKNQAPPGGK